MTNHLQVMVQGSGHLWAILFFAHLSGLGLSKPDNSTAETTTPPNSFIDDMGSVRRDEKIRTTSATNTTKSFTDDIGYVIDSSNKTVIKDSTNGNYQLKSDKDTRFYTFYLTMYSSTLIVFKCLRFGKRYGRRLRYEVYRGIFHIKGFLRQLQILS